MQTFHIVNLSEAAPRPTAWRMSTGINADSVTAAVKIFAARLPVGTHTLAVLHAYGVGTPVDIRIVRVVREQEPKPVVTASMEPVGVL